jgi:hypothetical protein
MTSTLIHKSDLEDFIATLRPEVIETFSAGEDTPIYISSDAWRVWTNPHWNDFTRQIVPPGGTLEGKSGKKSLFPDGAVLIWGDFNFWILAMIPPRFAQLSLSEVVTAIWPQVADPVLYPDADHPFWEAVGDRDMEVPGYPYELWVEYTINEEDIELERLDYFKSDTELQVELLARSETGDKFLADPNVKYFAQLWTDGQRIRI